MSSYARLAKSESLVSYDDFVSSTKADKVSSVKGNSNEKNSSFDDVQPKEIDNAFTQASFPGGNAQNVVPVW